MIRLRRARSFAALLVLPIATALLSFGCRQILGVEDRSEGSLVGQCGGYRYPTAECAACMDAACCDELEACDTTPTCDNEFSCVLACAGEDAACVARCFTYAGYPSPSIRGPLITCRAEHCAEACVVSCGDRTLGTTKCEKCMRDGCCAERRRCALNVDCSSISCVCFSGDSDCFERCVAESPSAADDLHALSGCLGNVCGADCGGGSWACLEEPRSWLTPNTTGDVSRTIELLDFSTFEPWFGIPIRVCASTDISCDQPLSTGITDEDGRANVELPVGTSGFDGYIEVVSDPTASNPIYAGILSFSTPPIVEENARYSFSWPSVAQLGALSSLLGIELDPTRGHLVLNAVDCYLLPAVGVSFFTPSDDPLISAYYFVQQLPSLDANATTAPIGMGGFVNVPAGSAVVKATVVDLGKEYGETSLIVRPGTLTYAYVVPGP